MRVVFFSVHFTCLLIVLNFFSRAYAFDIVPGETYRVTSTLNSTNDGDVEPGSLIRVSGTHQGWAYAVNRVGSDFVPQEKIIYISQDWLGRSVEPLGIDDVVRMVVSTPQEIEEATDAPCECDHDVEAAVRLALEESPPIPQASGIRPVRRPDNLVTSQNVPSFDLSSYIFKDEEEADQYFVCYQKDSDLQIDYAGTYKNSIRRMSRVYNQQTGGQVTQEDMDTLMSCLIFRESAHWRGSTSSSGARGLGQFTPDGRAEVKEIINYNPNNVRDHDDRIRERTAERDAGRISSAQLEQDIRTIEAQRRRHLRLTALKRMWEAMPMDSRPRAEDITADYTGNNSNHQAIMAMSALLVRNCQIRLDDRNYEMDARTSLLACAGAYNMGVGGFTENALVRDGPQTLDGWLENLRASDDGQSGETYNHLVSVHRCISDGENFPPCGTGQDYCSALPKADACQFNAHPKCLGECQ